MRPKKVSGSSAEEAVAHEHEPREVPASMTSVGQQSPTCKAINSCGEILSISQGNDMVTSSATPGAFFAGPRNDSDDFDSVVDDDPLPYLAVLAHLAPNEADVEARITEQLENEMNEILEAEENPTLIDSENVVVVQKDPPIRSWNKPMTWVVAISVVFLVVGAVLGVAWYQRQQDDYKRKEVSKIPLDPLVEELRSYIAPTDEDLLVFLDPTTPQSQALAWLQDDPITLTPGRLTWTVLQRYVLAVLYYSTSGPSWNNHHLNSDSVCTWNDKSGVSGVYCSDVCIWNNETSEEAVTCSSIGGTVDHLYLLDNNLVGTIPWELVLLTRLDLIHFHDNRLSGSIPARIKELSSLDDFFVSRNGLTGQLPIFSPAISRIDTSENMLTGSISESWLTEMTALHLLSVYGCMITGTISTIFGRLSNITYLDLSGNALVGTVPSELVLLTRLTFLSLDLNMHTGSIPARINELTSLDTFWAMMNELTGPLPMFSPSIRLLDVVGNMLTGSIPEGYWTSMTLLDDLRLSSNMLTGTLSTSIGLSNMTYFEVDDNRMTGSLPSELGQLRLVEGIYINGNSFTGSLNDTVCVVSGLVELHADCDEVDCPCCTFCCYDNGNDSECSQM